MPSWVTRAYVGVGLALVAAYSAALAWAVESQSYNVWGSLLLAPFIGAVNIVLIWWASRREDDPWVVRLLGIGLVLKMLGSFARYVMVFVLYGGGGDSNRYNAYAVAQHEFWRRGHFVWEEGGKTGTQNLELITTAVYTIIGPSPLAAYLVFASFAFWGCYFLYRAFRIALPDAPHRLYAALLFLLPSLLFWPSSIGKEAWLLLWIGVGALGVAKAFGGQPGGWVPLLLGAVGTSMIRPHVTVLLAAGILVAQMFRPVGANAMGALRKTIGVLIALAAVSILATQSAEFLGIDDLDAAAVGDRIDWASGQTEQGGSSFQPLPLTHPLGVPAAFVTLLFRPFPWEASGVAMLLQSAEGLGLIALCWWRRSSLRRIPGLVRSNPYVAFALLFTIAYIIAFSGFGNFGIIARQRTLMLPLALLLLALPPERAAWRPSQRPSTNRGPT